VRGVRDGSGGNGLFAHYEKGHFSATVEGAAFYREMLKAVVQMFTTRTPPIDYGTMREIIAFIQAVDRASESGAAVPVG
jgi:hypothetical protein